MTKLGEQRGVQAGVTGIVAVTQLAGGAMNLNPHFHLLVLDGVYSKGPNGMNVIFAPTRAPSATELGHLAERVHSRVLGWMGRRGMLHKHADDGQGAQCPEPDPIDACAQLSLQMGKLGHVDSSGSAHEPDPDEVRFAKRRGGPWTGEHEGFSIHAGTMVHQGDAAARERLCRYVLRPALSLSRFSWTNDGRVAYQVKYPRSPSHTRLLLEPVQLLARIASLIPPPSA